MTPAGRASGHPPSRSRSCACLTTRLTIDFGYLPFSVEEFYECLGLSGKYAEEAADRATAFAAHTPYNCPQCDETFASAGDRRSHYGNQHGEESDLTDELERHHQSHPRPSVWNLQLSLKLAVLDLYEGDRATDRYQEFQELAGMILQYPAQQIDIAYREYQHQADDDDEAAAVAPNQESLAESLGDVIDLPGVTTEDEMNLTEAQSVEEQIQQKLDRFSSA